jgi:hypothetical protein
MAAMAPVMALLPPPTGSRPPGPPMDRNTVQESLRRAGLDPSGSGEFPAELCYADLETAVRAGMSAGVTVRAVGLAGEEPVAAAVRAGMSGFVRPDGMVVLANRFNWVRGTRPPA